MLESGGTVYMYLYLEVLEYRKSTSHVHEKVHKLECLESKLIKLS